MVCCLSIAAACSYPVEQSRSVDGFLQQRNQLLTALRESIDNPPEGFTAHLERDSDDVFEHPGDEHIRRVIASQTWLSNKTVSGVYSVTPDWLQNASEDQPDTPSYQQVFDALFEPLSDVEGLSEGLSNMGTVNFVVAADGDPSQTMRQNSWNSKVFSNEDHSLVLTISLFLGDNTHSFVVICYLSERYSALG